MKTAHDWLMLAHQHIAVAEARGMNEANTQRLIIEPLLAWAGFDPWSLNSVIEQHHVPGLAREAKATRPDYALLADGGQVHALLEAKRFSDHHPELDEHNARRALAKVAGAAQNDSHRPQWAVLTSGRWWLLMSTKSRARYTPSGAWAALVAKVDAKNIEELEALKLLLPEKVAGLTRLATRASGTALEGARLVDAVAFANRGEDPAATTRPKRGATRASAKATDRLLVSLADGTVPDDRPFEVHWGSAVRKTEYWTEVLPAVVDLLGGRLPHGDVHESGKVVLSSDSSRLVEPTAAAGGGFVERRLFPRDIVRAARSLAVVSGVSPQEIRLALRPPPTTLGW